ncbi:MAG TPA: hypothetical protein VE549_05255, partial [Myxococcaceae bacterium]|nr:hypothetical protein [Myxococcaceae bacterium]
RHELRDERPAENARGTSYKDLHDCAARLICPLRRDTGVVCDSAQPRASDTRRVCTNVRPALAVAADDWRKRGEGRNARLLT